MIRVPDNQKRFSVPNNSDLFGNIHYTKNINFDEEGYIKQSPRAVNIVDSDYDADFNIPTSFGRLQSSIFYTTTIEDPFIVQIDPTAMSSVQDTDAGNDAPPSLTIDSTGTWWQNLWHVTTDDGLFSKDPSNGDWTDRSVTLTSGKAHPVEVFKTSANRTLCIGNGNVVVQINTSYSTSGIAQLTIPADFEVIDLAFNNGRIGVATKLSDTASGQSGEAYFFTWDGIGTSANGGWGVGSETIVGVVPYLSSFLLITKTGEGLYFNGGGFQRLFALPHYYLDRVWGDSVNREALGDIMKVDGDVVYFNLNNNIEPYGQKSEQYIANQPAGILCYDPKVGLYHYASPSISKTTLQVVSQANVNTSTDVMTVTGGYLHTGALPATGSPVKYVYDGTAQIGGLLAGKIYFLIKLSSSTFSLAETYEDALLGTKIDLTSTGAANNHFLMLDVVDYGASYMARSGAIGLAEMNTHTLDTMIFGGEYYPTDSSTDKEYLCALVSGFKNISYFVTAKNISDNLKDIRQPIFIKYKPLKTGESIIVKEKTKDIDGLPSSTPQNSQICTWSSNKELYVTADFSEAKAHLDAGGSLECEIISGAGAGQMSQVVSMGYDDGVYSFVLEDEIEGVSASDVCNILIENWNYIGTVTSDDVDGYKKWTSDVTSKTAKYKVILIGDGVTIEEFSAGNSVFKPQN